MMLDRFQREDLLREAWRRSPNAGARLMTEALDDAIDRGCRPIIDRPRVVSRPTRVYPREVQGRIEQIIRDGGARGASFADIARAVGRQVGGDLTKMLERGCIARSARGRYVAASLDPTSDLGHIT